MLVRDKLGDRRARNYETLPKGDALGLDVLEHPALCGEIGCDLPIEYDKDAGYHGGWKHADGSKPERHWIRARLTCRYCGNQGDGVKARQHAWHDAVECDRCGGHDGHAIGD